MIPFDFEGVQTADARMAELERFIEHVAGPRKPEYGEPAEKVASAFLPMPLRRLYLFAGRWPARNGKTSRKLLCNQDDLVSLDGLQYTSGGNPIFLWENQGVWSCFTKDEGDDPPVWKIQEKTTTLVCSSLSKFLVTFCMQELSCAGKFHLADDVSIANLQSQLQKAMPLWHKAPYAWGELRDFDMVPGLFLVCRGSDYCTVADYTDEGAKVLEAAQGEYSRLTLAFVPAGRGGRDWSMDIQSDGSGHLSPMGNSKAIGEFPVGTFLFPEVCERLLASAIVASCVDTWAVFAFRRGQGSSNGMPTRDVQLVHSIFSRALDAVKLKGPGFDSAIALKSPLALRGGAGAT